MPPADSDPTAILSRFFGQPMVMAKKSGRCDLHHHQPTPPTPGS